jgi:hypothetical protein
MVMNNYRVSSKMCMVSLNIWGHKSIGNSVASHLGKHRDRQLQVSTITINVGLFTPKQCITLRQALVGSLLGHTVPVESARGCAALRGNNTATAASMRVNAAAMRGSRGIFTQPGSLGSCALKYGRFFATWSPLPAPYLFFPYATKPATWSPWTLP